MKKKYVMKDWVYEGEVDNEGMPNGKGVINYNDGKILKGIFKNGVPVKGNFHMIDSIYEGELNPLTKPHGKGKLEFISGEYKDQIFEGIFKDGIYSKGKYSYTDGSYYNGFSIIQINKKFKEVGLNENEFKIRSLKVDNKNDSLDYQTIIEIEK